MRIGIEITPLTATRTGVGSYVYWLLKHLLLEASDMTFRAFSSGLQRPDARVAGGAASEAPFSLLAGHRRIGLPTRLLYQSWNLLGRPRVDALLGGVDVFHATNYFLPPVRSARRVLTVYDLSFLRYPELCSPKIVGPFSRHVGRFARAADAVLTCSEASRRDIVELLHVAEDRVTVAHGAVDDDFVPMERDKAEALLEKTYGVRPPFFLFVGTLEPRKNVDGILRAFAMASRDMPHALVLVGETGWNAEEIEALAAPLLTAGRVIRPGYVASGDLPAFYSAASAFMFPSRYEGFGLPVLEAMACGCPVICSERGSLPEVTGDAAVHADPEDTDAIADAMRRVAGDAALAAALVEKGRARAAAFSWRRSAQTVLSLYRRLG